MTLTNLDHGLGNQIHEDPDRVIIRHRIVVGFNRSANLDKFYPTSRLGDPVSILHHRGPICERLCQSAHVDEVEIVVLEKPPLLGIVDLVTGQIFNS